MVNPLVGKGKTRNIPTIEEVGSSLVTESKTNTEPSTNNNTGIDINSILPPEKKIVKKQVSIYLDPDVIQALNRFGDERGKGAKSDLVNNFLKQVFNIRQ